ncbi:sensor histidine kinase [Allokutzneria albata]|uniref:histidine kinase n=1 Tax=Allokutzneria albata TaxID=211114 RepID=A0A1H0BRY4_ALLAB|nr:histidine kinase [Allokutzneria albata]SDN48315.1 Signal transduction histidine kinase [Allokutzneria albata]
MAGVRAADRLAPSWFVVQVLGTVALVATVVTASSASTWLWLVYLASLACWALWLLSASWLPRTSLALLTVASLLPALAVGPSTDGTALIMVAVVLGRLAMLPSVSAVVIAAVMALDVLTAATSCLVFDRPPSLAFGAVVLCVFVTLLGMHPRHYQLQAAHSRQLLEQTRRAQREQARAAALDERTRIARELHDVLAHSLGALGVQLEVAEVLLTDKGDITGAVERVRRSRRLAAKGLAEARRAVAALRSDVMPLADAVTALAEDHRSDHGVDVEVKSEGEPRAISSAATVCLLGSVREALTNAAKHAPGAPVTITVRYRAADVQTEVRNARPERVGDTGATAEGYGLTGMRERLALVGGSLTTAPTEDGGWLVTAEVPG